MTCFHGGNGHFVSTASMDEYSRWLKAFDDCFKQYAGAMKRLAMSEPTAREMAIKTADRLRGTCEGMTEEENDMVYNMDHFAEELDDIVMCCETCGWWCDTHELDEHQVCEDCQKETDVPSEYEHLL